MNCVKLRCLRLVENHRRHIKASPIHIEADMFQGCWGKSGVETWKSRRKKYRLTLEKHTVIPRDKWMALVDVRKNICTLRRKLYGD